ncbi:MAG: RnfABCDGE type electron transport complex subunit B [Lachnospiraceae bacterium]|nr:RnfABCDGE type electron transport complex subunit B [Lachnospiraceae bacterium]
MTGVLIATAVVAVTGIIIGIFLGAAGEKFKVEVNEKELLVREELPGNNCGGCGFAGCDALAKAIAEGNAPVNGCPVGGDAVALKIAKIMGSTVKPGAKPYAFVKCSGNCEKAKEHYKYIGPKDCKAAMNTPGNGPKACSFGCTGFGSCKAVCEFGAIEIVDGIAVIDKEKCKACGKCVAACPKHLIEIVPGDTPYMVACSSQDKGKEVKEVCQAGCIGCSLCVKNCPAEAIIMQGNVAKIDPDKCVGCRICAEKCPAKVIKELS